MINDVVFSEIYGTRIDRMINTTFEHGVVYGMQQILMIADQFEEQKIPITAEGLRQYIHKMNEEHKAMAEPRSTSQSTSNKPDKGSIKRNKETPQVVPLFPKKEE